MKSATLILLIVILICSCKKTQEKQVDSSSETTTVALNKCSPKSIQSSPVRICLLEVQDSRCPISPDFVCVWEGYALAKFIFEEGAQQHQFTLSTKKLPNGLAQDTLINGYRIKLINITPYPGSTPAPTEAVLQITR